MDFNSYNKGIADNNHYNTDEYTKYSLFGTDSETFKDIMHTVQDIFPEQDDHHLLLTGQDMPVTEMCSSFDRGIDFSDSQMFTDPYDISPGAIVGLNVSMDTGALPKLTTESDRRRQPKKTKKRTTKDDQFSLPDSLYPDSTPEPLVSGYSQYSSNVNYQNSYQDSEIPVDSLYPASTTQSAQSGASGYSPYPNNDNNEDSYRENEIPVINFNDDSQLQIFSDSDFRLSGNSSDFQSKTLPEIDNTLFNTINNTDFADSIESEDDLEQDVQRTEHSDISNLSDAEKYRRIRDKNNEASKKFRRRKNEKISELASTIIPELEEKNRKLKNKSEQLESQRNDMMKYYNSIFKKQGISQEFSSLNR